MPLTGLDANVLGGMKQVNIVQIKKEHWQEKFRYFYPSNCVNCLSTGTRIDYDSFCRYRSMLAFRRTAWKRHKRKKHAAHYRLEWLFCGALKVDGSVTCFRLMMKSKEQPRTTPNTKLSLQGGLVSGSLKRFAKLCGYTRTRAENHGYNREVRVTEEHLQGHKP